MAFREGSFFTINKVATRKMKILAAWEASLKQGGSFGVREWAVANSLLSTSQRSAPSTSKMSPMSACKGTVLKLTTVRFVNGLGYSFHKWA